MSPLGITNQLTWRGLVERSLKGRPRRGADEHLPASCVDDTGALATGPPTGSGARRRGPRGGRRAAVEAEVRRFLTSRPPRLPVGCTTLGESRRRPPLRRRPGHRVLLDRGERLRGAARRPDDDGAATDPPGPRRGPGPRPAHARRPAPGPQSTPRSCAGVWCAKACWNSREPLLLQRSAAPPRALRAAEPVGGGTATHVCTWLLLEHVGPWARTPSRTPILPDGLGSELKRRARDLRAKILQSGGSRHPRHRRGSRLRRALRPRAAAPQSPRSSPTSARGARPRPRAFRRGGTTGRRRTTVRSSASAPTAADACCAEKGRPVARALDRAHPRRRGRSRIGGDRFAANIRSAPAGSTTGVSTGLGDRGRRCHLAGEPTSTTSAAGPRSRCRSRRPSCTCAAARRHARGRGGADRAQRTVTSRRRPSRSRVAARGRRPHHTRPRVGPADLQSAARQPGAAPRADRGDPARVRRPGARIPCMSRRPSPSPWSWASPRPCRWRAGSPALVSVPARARRPDRTTPSSLALVMGNRLQRVAGGRGVAGRSTAVLARVPVGGLRAAGRLPALPELGRTSLTVAVGRPGPGRSGVAGAAGPPATGRGSTWSPGSAPAC